MSPIIKHLNTIFPDLPLSSIHYSDWIFDKSLRTLGPHFYHKVLPYHPVLNLEYSIVCSQLRYNFLFPEKVTRADIVDRLVVALLLCELLEHVYLHYLIIPREVKRLAQQKELFKSLLTELNGSLFEPVKPSVVAVGFSLSQKVRDLTIQSNWYRILLNRSKRILSILNKLELHSDVLRKFIVTVDNYTSPFFSHMGWLFHLPRLMTNLFLMCKHTIPGAWMDQKERSLDWTIRLKTQIQRRYFELGNDLVWVVAGALTCFLLLGALAPIAVYLNTAAFAFDVYNAALRAHIELTRLYTLQKEYAILLDAEECEEKKQFIREYQHHISERINFENKRFTVHVINTILILSIMSIAIPAFAINPVIILVSAILLLLLWVVSFTLTRALEKQRPKDSIEIGIQVSQLGFFSKKNEEKMPLHSVSSYGTEDTFEMAP